MLGLCSAQLDSYNSILYTGRTNYLLLAQKLLLHLQDFYYFLSKLLINCMHMRYISLSLKKRTARLASQLLQARARKLANGVDYPNLFLSKGRSVCFNLCLTKIAYSACWDRGKQNHWLNDAFSFLQTPLLSRWWSRSLIGRFCGHVFEPVHVLQHRSLQWENWQNLCNPTNLQKYLSFPVSTQLFSRSKKTSTKDFNIKR